MTVVDTQDDLQKIEAHFQEAFSETSRGRYRLGHNLANELKDSGPLTVVLYAIRKTGKWVEGLKRKRPNDPIPIFGRVLSSIRSSIQYYLELDRDRGRDVSQWLSDAQTIREWFQDTIGIHSVEPWTISEEEAQKILDKVYPSAIRRIFETVGTYVGKQRDQLIFLSQGDVMDVLNREISKRGTECKKGRG